MSVLEEVTQKRDQCVKWAEEGGIGYQPAIDFYNRIIDEIERSNAKIRELRSYNGN